MSDFKAKMHQIVCWLGLHPRPHYIVYILYTYIFCVLVIGPWPPYYKIVPRPMYRPIIQPTPSHLLWI